jgi:hypothetical protein
MSDWRANYPLVCTACTQKKCLFLFKTVPMSQAIDKELQAYITMLNLSQKKSLLGVIKSFLKPAEAIDRISREQYNRELQEAESRIDAGHFITQDDVEKDAATW